MATGLKPRTQFKHGQFTHRQNIPRNFKMPIRRFAAATLALLVVGSLLLARTNNQVRSAAAMTTACQAFLKTLDEKQAKQCRFAFGDKERLNWHFIPRPRKGLPVKDL
ncbi:MAG TPA: hypothetical protein DCE47_22795, partial [Planctomycetaceae bacterium]|nr:hypothetical protein [Planctomycetaceae bacterium]